MADTSIKGHDQTAIHAICIKVIRMKTSAILLALAIVALYGCTYSVHPILTDADLTQDVDLSGTWQQQLPSDSNPERKPLVIECDGYHNNTSYDAVRLQEEFTLQIGKVGDGRYLQFIRSDFGTTKDGALACLPVYGFARFELKGEELHVFPVNEGNIIKLLKKKDVPFLDYNPYDMIRWSVLTGRTSELQSLIQESEKEMFRSSPIVFRRVPSTSEDQNEQSRAAESAVGPNPKGKSTRPIR